MKFRAIMLIGKAKKVFPQLADMAKQHPTRTMGEITENIKAWKRNHNLMR